MDLDRFSCLCLLGFVFVSQVVPLVGSLSLMQGKFIYASLTVCTSQFRLA